ncbi:MAG: ThiF family adenylyltransferase [Paraglaciecola chathamensis]
MGELEPKSEITPNIRDVILWLEEYSFVAEVQVKSCSVDGVVVSTSWRVDLPIRFESDGKTDSGVCAIEPILWVFPWEYPLSAPKPMLRNDFPITLPHINPIIEGEGVSPCIAEVDLTDLLHSSGIEAVFGAMTHWLNNAASGELLCPVQGWEPVRRDNASGLISADTYAIREELKNYAPVRYLQYRYAVFGDNHDLVLGHIETPSLGSPNSVFKVKNVGILNGIRHGPALLLQVDRIIEKYWAESVKTLADLKRLLKKLQLSDAFDARLKHVMATSSPKACATRKKAGIEEFMVVIAVKRPFNVIGADNPWELLPYRVCFAGNSEQLAGDVPVHAPLMIKSTCPAMLRSVSGVDQDAGVIPISFIGCGSLGSKMALHLAKSGRYEFSLVDNDIFSSHNNARYGAVVDGFNSIGGSKVNIVGGEIRALGVDVEQLKVDVMELGKRKPAIVDKKFRYILDTTASLPVRHFLAHHAKLTACLMHSLLYGKATMGVLAIEGKDRCVRVDDLMAYTNTLCVKDDRVQKAMYGGTITRESFGDGCSSATTIMDDIGLSVLSAAIAGKVNQYTGERACLDEGQISIGHLDRDYKLDWTNYVLPATLIIPRDTHFGWEIRVLGNIINQIERESEGLSDEQGGVLTGMVCHLSKTIYVTLIVPAPDGTVRTPGRLDIATDGLAEIFEDIHSSTNGQITFLGTWHSHPTSSPPSLKDRDTYAKLTKNYDLPVVMLVYTGGRIERV